MEGLLLAEVLAPLARRLPSGRGAWRFPDERTAVLPLPSAEGAPQALWIHSRPPLPSLGTSARLPDASPPRTPFQEQLAARATGRLLAVRQQGLDRVAELDFAASEGFVPEPPVTLVVELTGRNANLILLDQDRRILGVERTVLHERNRYRELRGGVAYLPPPPYTKLDPRRATPAELRQALQGARMREVGSRVDGIGASLGAALTGACDLTRTTRLEGEALERVVEALPRLAAAPAAFLERAGTGPELEAQRLAEERQRALALVRGAARRRRDLAERRLEDVRNAEARSREAGTIRQEADLLMAYGAGVAEGAARVTLHDFDGRECELTLDPGLDAFANARKRYQRARRLEARGRRAADQRSRLEQEMRRAEQALAALDRLGDEELRERARQLAADSRRQRRQRQQPGVRFRDAHGFEVVVGRNARENDAVTFRVARSRDLWLHVQGSSGAHVVVRAEGRQVPFDTVLFAARLAAGFSPARQSDNVAVDYTLRKNVWKVKGQPAGSVHFSQQKTVYVTPARDAAAAAGAGAGEG